MNSLHGHILLAAPHQLDPNFMETVVLVVAHSQRGAMGVILNRPRPSGGRPCWQRNFQPRDRAKPHLYFGGPVAGPLMAVHTDSSQADAPILPGLFFAGRKKRVLALLRGRKCPCKFFSGYVGWGPGQLEYEIEIGVWRALPGTFQAVFSRNDDLWRDLSAQASRLQAQALFHLKYIPADPRLN